METILNTILTPLPAWLALVLIVVGAVSLALGLIRLGYGAAVKPLVLDLIEQARLRRIPILTALGTGNKLDPTLLQVTDISKTSGCPLARVMRRELRARDIRRLKVVYSPEPVAETRQLEAPSPGRRSVPASVPWVPSTAGILMASAIVRDLIADSED